MLKPKTRSERVKEYGSFLYCSGKDTLCSDLDNDDGLCRRSLCYLEDPDYITMQKRIKRNVEENARRENERKAIEKKTPSAPIRRQTKTSWQILEEQIESREASARRLYKANKPKAADSIMREVMVLRGKLRNMKGI